MLFPEALNGRFSPGLVGHVTQEIELGLFVLYLIAGGIELGPTFPYGCRRDAPLLGNLLNRRIYLGEIPRL
jgi:hypothetical protein